MTVTDKVNEVVMSAEAYDEGLLFCNNRLKEQGKPAITTLPAGKPGDPLSCPCSNACGVWVGAFGWKYPNGRSSREEIALGNKPYTREDHPSLFVNEFDLKAEYQNETYLPVRGN